MIISFISGLLFLLCCCLVVGKKTDTIDKNVSVVVITHRSNIVTKIMHFFTELGKGLPTMSICLALLFFPDRNALALPVVIAVITTAVICKTLKVTIKRERPKDNRLVEEVDYSFPSSHALTSAALYGSIAFGIVGIFPELQVFIIIACILLPFVIGFSRVYLGIHYVFDVIGGWSLGLCIASLVHYLL